MNLRTTISFSKNYFFKSYYAKNRYSRGQPDFGNLVVIALLILLLLLGIRNSKHSGRDLKFKSRGKVILYYE